jgi:hypothetical protein
MQNIDFLFVREMMPERLRKDSMLFRLQRIAVTQE